MHELMHAWMHVQMDDACIQCMHTLDACMHWLHAWDELMHVQMMHALDACTICTWVDA